MKNIQFDKKYLDNRACSLLPDFELSSKSKTETSSIAYDVETKNCNAEDILLRALKEQDIGTFIGWDMLEWPLISSAYSGVAMRTKHNGKLKLNVVDLATREVRDVAA